MRLLYRINRTGTTVLVATHDKAMVDRMRRRVLELSRGRIVRDEATGLYARDETTREFAQRMRARRATPGAEPMRFGFFLKEAVRAMRRNAAPTFAALATVLVTMLVLGVFIPIVQATRGAANSVRGRVLVDVYMKTDATRADDARVAARAARAPARRQVVFVSKAQALAQQTQAGPGGIRAAVEQPAARHLPRESRQPGERAAVRNELTPTGPGGGDADDRSLDPERLEPHGRHQEAARGDQPGDDHCGAADRCC